MAILAILSFLPNHDKVLLHTEGHFHRWGHLVAFAATTVLLASSRRSLSARFAMASLVAFFGYCVEFLQHILFNNPLELYDIATDTMGVLLGLVFVLLWVEISRMRRFD